MFDKSVPLPKKNSRGYKGNIYGFGEMQIGDSFLDVGGDFKSCKYRAAYAYARKKGWKMTARLQDEGIRVWRME